MIAALMLSGCEWIVADMVCASKCDDKLLKSVPEKDRKSRKCYCTYGDSVFCLFRPSKPISKPACIGDEFPCFKKKP